MSQIDSLISFSGHNQFTKLTIENKFHSYTIFLTIDWVEVSLKSNEVKVGLH